MKNYELYNSVPAIAKLLNQDLPIKLAFQLKKIKKAIEPILTLIEETKKEIETKYKTDQPVLDKDGKVVEGAFFISEQGNKERNEFFSLESKVEFEKIDVDDLVKANVTLSVADLELLDWLLK